MKIKIINEKCIKCGMCGYLAKEIFEVYDTAVILKQPQTEEEKNNVNYAILACPTAAIEEIKKEQKKCQ